jgi:hypothetical protein
MMKKTNILPDFFLFFLQQTNTLLVKTSKIQMINPATIVDSFKTWHFSIVSLQQINLGSIRVYSIWKSNIVFSSSHHKFSKQ